MSNRSSGWARGDLAGSLAVPRLTTPPETDGWNQGAPFDIAELRQQLDGVI